MTRNYLLLFSILMCFTGAMSGQSVPDHLRFRHLTTKEGLSTSVVLDMISDDQGKLFLGVWGGLNTFDGTRCYQFPQQASTPDALSNSRITGFVRDASNRLWFGTESLCMYDPRTNSFKSHFITFDNNQPFNDFIIPFYIDHKEDIWLFAGKYQKIIRFDIATATFDTTGVYLGDYTQNTAQSDVMFLPLDTVWSFRENIVGVKRSYLDKSGQRIVEQLFDGRNGMPRLTLTYQIKYNAGVIWIAAKEGLIKYDVRTARWKLFNSYKGKKITHVSAIKIFQQSIWIGTRGSGLYLFDIPSATFVKNWQHDPADIHSISGNDIQTIDIDTAGFLKVAVLYSGVDYCNIYDMNFRILNQKSADKSVWMSRMARDQQDNVWFAIPYGGLEVIDPVNLRRLYKFNTTNSLMPSDNITDIYCDNTGKVWIATEGGLCYFDPVRQQIRLPDNMDDHGIFYYTCQLQDNSVYSISAKELYLIDETKGNTVLKNVSFNHPFYKKFPHYGFCHEVSKNQLLINNKNGTYIFQRESPAFFRFYQSLSYRFGSIIMISEQDALHALFCFESKVMSFNKNTLAFEQAVYSNEFKEQASPVSVIKDSRGNTWIGTIDGLWVIRPDGTKRRFSTVDGLPSNEFVGKTALLHKNGTITMGTSDGLVNFDPRNLQKSYNDILLDLHDVEINYRKYAWPYNYNTMTEIVLPFNRNTVSFSISAIDFSDPEFTQIEYQLVGYEEESITTNNPATIRYPNLPPGKYTLEIKAFKPGTTGKMDRTIGIIIQGPWYKSWWFISLLLLLAGWLVWYFFQQRTKRLLAIQKAEIDKKLALETERNRIARDIHDDISSGLSAINLLANYIQQNPRNSDMHKEILRITESSRDINQRLREIIWSVSSEADNLESLISFLRRYLLDFGELHPIATIFSDPETIPKIILTGEIRQNLFLCFKEVLNNVAKYAQASKLEVTITLDEKQVLFIEIKDDGIGFEWEQAMKKGGNGLKNIQVRMAKVGGEARFLHENGTTVILSCPV
jgi:signal transduction histidine kinase/ligand-binding sensor domain-containing protein